MREAFTHIDQDYPATTITHVENNTTYGDSYVSTRDSYLGVSAVPVKKVDVTYSSLGGGGTWQSHYNWIVSNMNTDLLVSAPATIGLSYVRTGGSVTVTAVLTLTAAITGTHKMWMVFTENKTSDADNAPHYYVRTGRAGTNSDMLVTISSAGQTQTFNWTFKLKSAWSYTNTDHYMVAFLEQDSGNKTVVQAKQITANTLNGFTDVEPASLGAVKSMFH